MSLQDVLNNAGNKPVKVDPVTEDKPTTQVEQDPELQKMQDKWLSIHNDFLFTRI